MSDASNLIKEVSTPKFDASIDLHIRLGVDPRKADQAIRGVANLPHGTGKTKRVLVFCNPDKEAEAKEAGADYAGLQEFVEKVEKGWTEIDVIIATPSVMPKIAVKGLTCTTAVHICYGYGIKANTDWKETLGQDWRQYAQVFPALAASSIQQVSLECYHSHVPPELIGIIMVNLNVY